jgi:hypothetical protein
MKKFVVLIVFLGLLSLPLMAQEPKVEVFGGYQYQHIGNIGNSGTDVNANGWDASLTGYINRYFGITGDFGGVYKSVGGANAHIYTYAGGPVLAYREGKVNPFVHVLLGGASLGVSNCGGSCPSFNGFTTMFGGGVDFKASRAVSIRLADFDWVYYRFQGVGFSNNVRLTTGIVLRF